MQYLCGPVGREENIEICLPEGKNKKILFALSGGADSAILLYLLAKMNKESQTNHSFVLFTVPRPDGGAQYSPEIVSWINKRLDINLPMPIIYGNGSLPHDIVVKTAIADLMKTGAFDMLYVAENKIPEISIGGLAPVRAVSNKFKKAMLPFWHLTKEYTIDLYYRANVEDLLSLSHSCTELKIGRCNKCFQCNERKLAFSLLSKNDPGEK